MSCITRKPCFCNCEKKAQISVQLISSFVFATYKNNPSYILIPSFKPLTIFFSCTARFMSDLIRNHKDRFCCDDAQIPLKPCHEITCFRAFQAGNTPTGYSTFVVHICNEQMSRVMRKPTFWFLTRSDTNQAVQSQKIARGLKFRIRK